MANDEDTSADANVANAEEVEKLEEISISDSDDDFPDLKAICTPLCNKFYEGHIVWAHSKKVWWPAFIRKLYHREKKASLIFINCQHSRMKIPFTRIKNFHKFNFFDLWLQQKDLLPGLGDAMQIADSYVKHSHRMEQSGEAFFKLSFFDQRRVLNQFSSPLKRKHDNEEAQICDEETPKKKAKLLPKELDSPVSEAKLSKRENRKLLTAIEARKTMNKKYLKYIKSKKCLKYLISIAQGKIRSQRHEEFEELKDQDQFFKTHLLTKGPGFDFFGETNRKQYNECLEFLLTKFEEFECNFTCHSADKRTYVMLVLLPEAIKNCLMEKDKISDEKCEDILANGYRQTQTERKASRISSNLIDSFDEDLFNDV